jgi:hypothetical protein
MCLYIVLTWRWPTFVETCRFNKQQIITCVYGSSFIFIIRKHKELSTWKNIESDSLSKHQNILVYKEDGFSDILQS